MSTALDQAMAFLMEADKLKTVERSNVLQDSSRPENAAEHSWHLALCALVLAGDAPQGADIDRVIAMLLLHDLPEIDAGDMPVHHDHDADALARAEQAGADRLFGLLPPKKSREFHDIRTDFEAGISPSAVYAKRLDHLQPALQTLQNPAPPAKHLPITRHTLTQGRAARLAQDWPEAHGHAMALLNGESPTGPLAQRMAFLSDVDRLKGILRATLLTDRSRHENSAEHSWHVALMALTLPCPAQVDRARAVRMLILHDLVEIDAGDAPVFGEVDTAAVEAAEAKAADRIFGLLPGNEGAALRAIWDEFEALETPTAIWAKALDRFHPPNMEITNGGSSWVTYEVTHARFLTRVAPHIERGAPDLWAWLAPRVAAYFEARV